MLRLKNETVRKGMWTYTDPDTGAKFARRSFAGLLKDAQNHRQSKHLPIPINFIAIVEHNYCVENPDQCYDENPPPPPQPTVTESKPEPSPAPITNFPHPLQQIKNLLKSSVEWVKSGFKLSTRDQAERRLAVCVQCPYWTGARDILHFRCKKCGCCSRIKVAMASERCPDGRW